MRGREMRGGRGWTEGEGKNDLTHLLLQIPGHATELHYLLLLVKVSHSQMVLRPIYPYQLPLSKATHYGRDFAPYIHSCINKYLILSHLTAETGLHADCLPALSDVAISRKLSEQQIT